MEEDEEREGSRDGRLGCTACEDVDGKEGYCDTNIRIVV